MPVAYLHGCHRAQPDTAALRGRDTYLHIRVAICIQSTFDGRGNGQKTSFFAESFPGKDQTERKGNEEGHM